MVQYVNVEIDVIVNDETIKQVRRGLEKVTEENWFLFPDMTVDENGYLELSDYFVSYDTEKERRTHEWLSPFVTKGYIYFNGTDYGLGLWRAKFDGKGCWKFQDGEVRYKDRF